MIPRFVIRNAPPGLIGELQSIGYTLQHTPVPADVLVLGDNILQAPYPEKNPLLKVFDFSKQTYTLDRTNMWTEIIILADIQKRWTNNTIKTELLLGDPKKGKVIVTALGVMIDSCIISIDMFRKLQSSLKSFHSPFVVSHAPTINPVRPFITVGCADYSIDDLQTIITAYELLKPSS